MSEQATAKDPTHEPDMTQFGIFYPVGYIVAAFPKAGDAQKVQQDLMTGGYEQKDCPLYAAAEVADSAARNLKQNTGFLASLGWSDDAVRKHLAAAQEGATILLIYAPSDIEAARAMNVVRRVPFAFAHRYHRLTIEELK